MWLLVIEVVLLVFGTFALSIGEFKVSGKRTVTGAPARIAGFFLLLPLPLTLLAGFGIGLIIAARGQRVQQDDVARLGALLEIGICAISLTLAVLVCLAAPATSDGVPGRSDPARRTAGALPWILGIGGSTALVTATLAAVILISLGNDWMGLPPIVKPLEPSVQPVPFGDSSAQKISLENGFFEARLTFTGKDPVDPSRGRLAKLFLVSLGGQRLYRIQARTKKEESKGTIPTTVRASVLNGGVVNLRPILRQGGLDWYMYAPTDDTYRIVVTAAPNLPEVSFAIAEAAEDDDAYGFEWGPITKPAAQIKLMPVKSIEPYIAAAIAPDSTSAWVTTSEGKLLCYSLPDLDLKGIYDLHKPCHMMAMDRRGKLYAATRREGTSKRATGKKTASPEGQAGPADILVYDTKDLPPKGTLKPQFVFSVDTFVRQLLIAPDDAWLYYLDGTNRKVGRIDLAQLKPAGEVAELNPDTSCMCLTSDGKFLFTADYRELQQIDTNPLQITKTVRTPIQGISGIQATDKGQVFLRASYLDPVLFVVDLGRVPADPNATAGTPRWSSNTFGAFVLSADQGHMFAVTSLALEKTRQTEISALSISERPFVFRAYTCGTCYVCAPVRSMEISRDGSFIFCDCGAIVKVEK
ncbi:MAG: hypothetical protein HY040_16140 [Planctomycetes bacterium]|nr:hypothetical protein [Planctomycetota bacterium]